MNILKAIIWLAITLAFIRGLFVFDMGWSAKNTFPTASAICLVGAIVSAVLMYTAEKKQ